MYFNRKVIIIFAFKYHCSITYDLNLFCFIIMILKMDLYVLSILKDGEGNAGGTAFIFIIVNFKKK